MVNADCHCIVESFEIVDKQARYLRAEVAAVPTMKQASFIFGIFDVWPGDFAGSVEKTSAKSKVPFLYY